MSRFPTEAHLASWARICPGNHESAGKRKSGHTGHANRWLKAALCQAATAASKKKDSYLQALYKRIVARRGHKRAIIAVAHAILVTVYHLLRTGHSYQDLGSNYFDQRDRDRVMRRTVRRLENLGYRVTLEAA
jgi:transposase